MKYLIFFLNYVILIMPNKLNILLLGYFFFFRDISPFFRHTFCCDEFDKMQIPYTMKSIVYTQSVYGLFGDDWNLRFCALITVGALFIYARRYTMGLLKDALGLAGIAAASGIAAAASILGNKEAKLAELERAFSETTREYKKQKAKLEEKISKGNKRAIDKLNALEDEYSVQRRLYESKKKKLLPKKTKEEEERETANLKHKLEMERIETEHALRMQEEKRHSLALENTTTYSNRNEAPRKIRKCPCCGEPAKAFEKCCPLCNFEYQDMETAFSIKLFQEELKKLEQAKNECYTYRYIQNTTDEKSNLTQQKIDLIKTFPIPNTKEDILEFMILASSNFDSEYYNSHLDEEDISDAWLAKVKQCYQKAVLVFGEDKEFLKVEKIYQNIMQNVNGGQKTWGFLRKLKK